MLSKVGGWKVERRWTLSREVAFASKVGICRLRVKGIDGVRARLECLGTGILPRLANQIDYQGTHLSDSGPPLGTGSIYNQACIDSRLLTIVFSIQDSLDPRICQMPESVSGTRHQFEASSGEHGLPSLLVTIVTLLSHVSSQPYPVALRRLSMQLFKY